MIPTTALKNRWVSRGALLTALGVLMGAFGSHFLKSRIEPHSMETYKTAVQHHVIHGLGLVLFGIWAEISNRPDRIGWFLFIGSVVFSFSLYLLAITGLRFFGFFAPLGGIMLVLGWLLFSRAAR